jgi:hypothetical protein
MMHMYYCVICVPYVTINIIYCNDCNPSIYLTQMSWAMVFCAIKVIFSCSGWMVHRWLLLLFVPSLMTLYSLWRLQGSVGRVTCVLLVTNLFVNSYDFYFEEEKGGTKRLTNSWWSLKITGLYQMLITSWK